jgi:hypothetical protein
MPKQVLPAVPGYNGQIYSDDSGTPTQLNLDHLDESFQLSALLQQLGHGDAAEFARPVHLISGFKPAALVEKLLQYSEDCSSPACIACINGERLPEFIWSYDCANAVNRLVNLRVAGGHVLGILIFPAVGEVCVYPESGDEAPLYLAFLNVFARGFATQPQYLPANELLSVGSLDEFSDWQEKFKDTLLDPIQFPDSRTETVQS